MADSAGMLKQSSIKVRTRGRGTYEITGEVARAVEASMVSANAR